MPASISLHIGKKIYSSSSGGVSTGETSLWTTTKKARVEINQWWLADRPTDRQNAVTFTRLCLDGVEKLSGSAPAGRARLLRQRPHLAAARMWMQPYIISVWANCRQIIHSLSSSSSWAYNSHKIWDKSTMKRRIRFHDVRYINFTPE